MAQNPNFNELATTTLNLWVSKKFADNFTGQNPLWYLLRKNGGLGIKALEPLYYADAGGPQLAGVLDPYAEVLPSATTGFTNAEWQWCEKLLPVSISEMIMDQQGSETSRINYLNTVKDISMKKFMEGLAADLWRAEGLIGTNGQSAGYIGSIRTYLNRGGSSTTNTNTSIILPHQTYAGTDIISGSSTTVGGAAIGTTPLTNVGGIERNGANGAFWCTPVYNPGSADTLSVDRLNYVYNLAIRDTDEPDLIVMDRQNYGSFMAIQQAFQRYESGGLADAGFSSMKFRGADVVFDDRCPAQQIFFINTNYLKLRCASMAPKFVLKPDPHRPIVNWQARWVGQITSGFLGRSMARHANIGN